MSENISMPAKVAEAISKVQAAIKQIAKSEKNQHGGYAFASIDDFLVMTSPICAEAGLVIVQDEDSFEVREGGNDKNGKPTNWLHLSYVFTLAHTSGETWVHRPRRSIIVNASMGSQAFGAAQSYVLKQFMRSLFQIATGDKEDVDHEPASDLPKYTPARSTQRGQRPAQGQKQPTLLQTAETVAATGYDKLKDWWGSLTPQEVQSLDPHKANLIQQARDFDAEREHIKGE